MQDYFLTRSGSQSLGRLLVSKTTVSHFHTCTIITLDANCQLMWKQILLCTLIEIGVSMREGEMSGGEEQ